MDILTNSQVFLMLVIGVFFEYCALLWWILNETAALPNQWTWPHWLMWCSCWWFSSFSPPIMWILSMFVPSSKASHPFFPSRKIRSVASPREIWLRTRHWGIEREEKKKKSLAPSKNGTLNLKSLVPEVCALPLRCNNCPRRWQTDGKKLLTI